MKVEESLISGLLVDASGIADLELSPEMFENPSLGRLYYDLLHGADDKVLIDRYGSDPVMSYALQQCLENFTTSVRAPYYAKQVRNEWKRRQAETLLGQVLFKSEDIDDQINELSERLADLREEKEDGEHTLGQLVEIYKDKCFTEHEMIQTGFYRLDRCLGGLERGDVVVIGARPAVGKSALGSQLARAFSGQKLNVGYFNLEMLDFQIYQRFIAQISGIDLSRLRNAVTFKDKGEQEAFERANKALEGNGIKLFTGGKTIADIRAKSKGLDVVIVDYLQLVTARATYAGNRVQEVSEVSRELKNLASDLHCVVIVLSQLNRETEKKKRPTLADLRDSGAIEQDASVVLLMWKQGEDRAISVEKNRQGNVGSFVYEFDGAHMTFKETSKRVSRKASDGFTSDEELVKTAEALFK